MKDFRDEIIGFLNGTRAGATGLATTSLAAIQAKELYGDTVSPTLVFSVLGNMRLVVTDGQGRRSGVLNATGEMVNEIPEAAIEANDAGSSVTIANPPAGPYRLTYYGLEDGDFSLAIAVFDTTEEAVEKTFRGYRPDVPQMMTVTYDPAGSEKIVLQPAVLPPQDFAVEPYSCEGNWCTRLKWKASQHPGVSIYIVYRSLADEPIFSEISRVSDTATSFDTGEAWNSTEGFPVHGYAIAAFTTSGAESFFAEEKVIQAGDVDQSGGLDMSDAILTLQVVAGLNPAVQIFVDADIDDDRHIGLAEAVYILRQLSE